MTITTLVGSNTGFWFFLKSFYFQMHLVIYGVISLWKTKFSDNSIKQGKGKTSLWLIVTLGLWITMMFGINFCTFVYPECTIKDLQSESLENPFKGIKSRKEDIVNSKEILKTLEKYKNEDALLLIMEWTYTEYNALSDIPPFLSGHNGAFTISSLEDIKMELNGNEIEPLILCSKEQLKRPTDKVLYVLEWMESNEYIVADEGKEWILYKK